MENMQSGHRRISTDTEIQPDPDQISVHPKCTYKTTLYILEFDDLMSQSTHNSLFQRQDWNLNIVVNFRNCSHRMSAQLTYISHFSVSAHFPTLFYEEFMFFCHITLLDFKTELAIYDTPKDFKQIRLDHLVVW